MRKFILPLVILIAVAALCAGCSEDPLDRHGPAGPTDSQTPDFAAKVGDGYCHTVWPVELSGMSNAGILLVEFTSTATNFPDKSFQLHPEYGVEIADLMFDTDPAAPSVHNLYQEMTDDAVGFTGNVIGSYVIDDSYNDTCDNPARFARNRAAYAEAASQGVDFSPYDVLIYVVSTDNPCSPIWILISEAFHVARYPELEIPEIQLNNWSWSPTDFAHELGHLFGWGHSGDGEITYGDFSCFMGENTDYTPPAAPAPLRHLNVCWKISSDYITAGQIYPIEGEVNEVVNLAPSEYLPGEMLAGSYKTARLLSENGALYVSYRQPRGPFDLDEFGSRPWEQSANRVLVHKPSGSHTDWLATLEAGQVYEGTDFRITALEDGLSGDVDQVAVQIELGNVWNCGQGAELSCAESIRYSNVAPHRPQTFQTFPVDVTNLDPELCDPTTFSVYSTPGSGNLYFNDLPGSIDLVLDGGETQAYVAGMEFTEIPPDGNYSVHTVVSANGDHWYQDVTWVLDTVQPAVPANVVADVTAANTVTLTWNAVNDYPAGVDFYDVELNGAVVDSPTDPASTHGGLALDTPYTFRVRATDKAGNVGDWSDPVVITIPSIVISNIVVTHNGLDCTKTVTWTTNVPSSSVLQYGNTCGALGWVEYGAGNTTNHSVTCDVEFLRSFAYQVESSADFVTETSDCKFQKRGYCIKM